MLTPSLLTKPFSKLVRRHAALVYSFNFFSILATHYYKTPCYKRDHYDVIIMVFMARFLFNQWYACSGRKHLVDYVFFQSELSTSSDIHTPERVTSRSVPFQLRTITVQ